MRARLLEGHPEVSFREMARSAGGGAGVDDRPLAHGKASVAGLRPRADLLAAAGISIPRSAYDALGTAALDDVYDATAMAWTAFPYRPSPSLSRSNPSRAPATEATSDGSFATAPRALAIRARSLDDAVNPRTSLGSRSVDNTAMSVR